MEVHLTPDLEKELADVASKAGRDANELAQDVIAGYLGGSRRCVERLIAATTISRAAE